MSELSIDSGLSNVNFFRKDSWISVFSSSALFLWVFIVLSDNLKLVLFPKIHWIATAFLLPIVLWGVLVEKKTFFKKTEYWYPWLGVLFALVFIISALFVQERKLYTAVEGCKLLVIFLIYFLISNKKSYVNILFSACIFSVILNAIFLILGKFSDFKFLSWIQFSGNRDATFLAEPGPLSIVGMTIFFYSLALFILSPLNISKLLKSSLLFLSASIVLVFDGSRTALIGVFLAFSILPLLAIFCNFPWRTFSFWLRWFFLVLVFIALSVYPIFFKKDASWTNRYFYIFNKIHHENSQSISMSEQKYNHDFFWNSSFLQNAVENFWFPDLKRVLLKHDFNEDTDITRKTVVYFLLHHDTDSNSLSSNQNSNVWIQKIDNARFQMLSVEKAVILSHPLWGKGFGMTVLHLPVSKSHPNGTVVIHNAYLQIWGDVGFLGFLCFLILSLGWLRYIPDMLSVAKKIKNPKQLCVFLNAIFLLFYFSCRYLFHPTSTEWVEWMIFLIPCAIIFNYLGSYKKEIV